MSCDIKRSSQIVDGDDGVQLTAIVNAIKANITKLFLKSSMNLHAKDIQ